MDRLEAPDHIVLAAKLGVLSVALAACGSASPESPISPSSAPTIEPYQPYQRVDGVYVVSIHEPNADTGRVANYLHQQGFTVDAVACANQIEASPLNQGILTPQPGQRPGIQELDAVVLPNVCFAYAPAKTPTPATTAEIAVQSATPANTEPAPVQNSQKFDLNLDLPFDNETVKLALLSFYFYGIVGGISSTVRPLKKLFSGEYTSADHKSFDADSFKKDIRNTFFLWPYYLTRTMGNTLKKNR